MNLDNLLAELRAERDQVEQAILVLQRIAAERGRRRVDVEEQGRPPGSKNKSKVEA